MSDDYAPPSPPSPWEVAGETAAAVVELGAPAAELTPEAEARIIIYGRITAVLRRMEADTDGLAQLSDPDYPLLAKLARLVPLFAAVDFAVFDAVHIDHAEDVDAMMTALIDLAAGAVAWIESYITRPPRGGDK